MIKCLRTDFILDEKELNPLIQKLQRNKLNVEEIMLKT